MTKFEFCKAVLARFNGTWPIRGGLAFAAEAFDDKKTVDQAEALMRAKMAAAIKKQKLRG